MLKNDIEINGISVNLLLQQREDIKEGATKFISDGIDSVTKIIKDEMPEVTTKESLILLANQALETLQSVEIVSSVSGVSFFLPYTEDYGSSDGVLSHMLDTLSEDVEDDIAKIIYDCYSVLSPLMDLLYEMESTSKGWYSSNC